MCYVCIHTCKYACAYTCIFNKKILQHVSMDARSYCHEEKLSRYKMRLRIITCKLGSTERCPRMHVLTENKHIANDTHVH
jgi:hypothetical protein